MKGIKQQKRPSRLTSSKKNLQIKFHMPTFHLKNSQMAKKIQTYNSYSEQQIKKILDSFIDKKKFKNLVCDALKLQYLYYPIITTLSQQDEYMASYMGTQYKVHQIVSVIIQNKFYRNIPKQNQFALVQNNKSTLINLRCLIAGLLAYSSSKLSLLQIEHTLKIFGFEQKLNDTYPYGIPLQTQKISKIIKKLQRSIKPIDFKLWLQDFKNITNGETIQNYQFLYLLNLSQRKIQQDNYMFMTTKKNLQKMMQNQGNQSQKQNKHFKILQNGLGNDQKFRIKSFSYQQNKYLLPVVINYQNIQKNIKHSNDKLFNRKKSLSLLARTKNLYQNEQSSHNNNNNHIKNKQTNKKRIVKFKLQNSINSQKIKLKKQLKQRQKQRKLLKLSLNNSKNMDRNNIKNILNNNIQVNNKNIKNDYVLQNMQLKKLSNKFFEISDRKLNDINQMMERLQNSINVDQLYSRDSMSSSDLFNFIN